MADDLAYVTTTQVAAALGVGSSAVRSWVAKGVLTPAHTTPGGHHRFRREDVEAFRDSRNGKGNRAAS